MLEIINITDKDIDLDIELNITNVFISKPIKYHKNNKNDKISYQKSNQTPKYPKLDIVFPNKHRLRRPKIHELFDINITDNKGYIHFNGNCYYQPIKDVIKKNPIGYQRYLLNERYTYRYLPCTAIIGYKKNAIEKIKHYLVEFTDMEYIEDTSNYFYDDEEGLNICLFPTGIVKLFFTILEEKENYKNMEIKLNSFYEFDKL